MGHESGGADAARILGVVVREVITEPYLQFARNLDDAEVRLFRQIQPLLHEIEGTGACIEIKSYKTGWLVCTVHRERRGGT